MQLTSWQREFAVVPPTSWVCDLATALADASNTDPRVIEDFQEFWRGKKCYGSYQEARDAILL